MSQVSSIRWNDPLVYQRAKQLASLKQEKISSIVNQAVIEYLRKHEKELKVSELHRQTASFSEESDNLNLDDWSEHYDTEGWVK